MSSLGWDLRRAIRAIVKQPGLSLAVALTLALGLGINATVFGMADALALRPFRFRDYERIAVLAEIMRGASQRDAVAPANFLDWRRPTRNTQATSAASCDANGPDGGAPVRVKAPSETPRV